MHYYQFNIADYQSHTKHLTPIEDICYRRLLDWQYLHEKPIPNDINSICRLLVLREFSTDVEQMLNEFFTLTDEGWINSRAFEEIEQFHDKSKKASEAGKASAAKRSLKNSSTNNQQDTSKNERTFNGCSTDVQPTINQEPRTKNHKPPLKEKHEKEKPDFEKFWDSYPKKVGKQDALKIWNKKKPDIGNVLKALYWQTKSQQWLDGFIPNPSTYLNQGRWEDEPQPEYHARGSPSQTKMDAINSAARAIFKGHSNNERDITDESEVIEHSFDS